MQFPLSGHAVTGLLLIFVATLWLVIAVLLAILFTVKVPKRRWRMPLRTVLLLVLIPLPVIDEIVGKEQFERLCIENSKVTVSPTKAPGSTVYLQRLPDEEIKGTWVRVARKPWHFVDASSGELVVSYSTLTAAGGWFVHVLPLSEGRVPLLFKGSCAPANRPATVKTFKDIGINYIERPKGDLK